MDSEPPACSCAKPAFCSKTAVKPAFWPPDGQDGLRTSLLAPKTASGRASWRPRRPPDGPPGVQDGSGRASCRPRRCPDGPPGVQDGLRTGLLALKTAQNGSLIAKDSLWTRFLALDMFALLPVSLCLHDNSLDETSGISTWLPINFAAC